MPPKSHPQKKQPKKPKNKNKNNNKTVNLPSGNNTATARVLRGLSTSKFATYLALPHESKAVRYSDEFTCAPTAIASPYTVRKVDFSLGRRQRLNMDNYFDAFPYAAHELNKSSKQQMSPSVPNGEFFIALFRNIVRSMIVHDTNPTGLISEYAHDVKQTIPLDFTAINTPYLKCSTLSDRASPHGPLLFTGKHHSDDCYWVDASAGYAAVVDVTFGNQTTDLETLVVEVTSLVGNDFVYNAISPTVLVRDSTLPAPFHCRESNIALVSMLSKQTVNVSFYITRSCYIRIRAKVDKTVVAEALYSTPEVLVSRISIKSCSDFLGHLPVPHVAEKMSAIESVRVNAVACLLTNESPLLQLQGKVVGIQFGASHDWQSALQYNDVAGLNNAHQSQLKDGKYGFLKPSQPHDFGLQQPFIFNDAGEIEDTTYSVIPEHDYLVISAQTGVGVSVAQTTEIPQYLGGVCYITPCWGLEFRTSDVWFPQSTADVMCTSDLLVIRRLPQWHENPLHFSDVLNFVKRAAGWSLRVGSALAPLARMLAAL